MVNSALPEKFRDYNRLLTKGDTDTLLAQIAKDDPDSYRDISWKLMQLGREAAFTEGTTLRLSDTRNQFDKSKILAGLALAERKIKADKTITPIEREKQTEVLYGETQRALTDATYDAALANNNPFAMQVKSKARGNKSQLAALLSTPSVYQDANDHTIPVFINRSYAEGLDPSEYWAATYGARKGVIATKFCLAAGTQVLTGDGSTNVPIETLKPGDIVWTMDDYDKLIQTTVVASTCVGDCICEVFEFGIGSSSSSRLIEGTSEHKLFMEKRNYIGSIKRSMEPLSKAAIGRRSAVLPSGMSDCGMIQFSKSKALILGVLLGDGGLTTQQTKMYLSDSLLINVVNSCVEEHNLKLHLDEKRESVSTYSLQEIEKSEGIGNFHKTPFRSWLSDLGVLGKYANEKDIPSEVYSWDSQAVGSLVAGLWATDGCTTHVKNKYHKEYPVVTYYCTSEKLVQGLKKLLEIKLGVYSSPITCRKVAGNTSNFSGREVTRNYDLYGFMISDITSLTRLVNVCPVVAEKIKLLHDKLLVRRKRKPNFLSRFRNRASIGLRKVYDIEVAHDSHRFVLANGLVVSNSTRDAGALGKQFGVAVSTMVVTGDDCGTPYGIPVKTNDNDNLGSVLAQSVGGFPAGTVINKEVLSALNQKKLDHILVRSPITCGFSDGVCKHCAGQRENGRFPEVGHHLGLNASSALAEQIAQNQLNQKHSGGQSDSKGNIVYSGFDIIDQLAKIPKTFPHRASVAELDGEVESVEPAPQGGTNVLIGGTNHYVSPDFRCW